jgi:hypothetical protein
MPRITTTIRSSMSVNPRVNPRVNLLVALR